MMYMWQIKINVIILVGDIYMGIIRRVLFAFLILLVVNYIFVTIFSVIGMPEQDSMPIVLWFSCIAILLIILPSSNKSLFG